MARKKKTPAAELERRERQAAAPRAPRRKAPVQLELAPPVATAEELQARQDSPEYGRSRDGLTG
jgi:hypothetical protein